MDPLSDIERYKPEEWTQTKSFSFISKKAYRGDRPPPHRRRRRRRKLMTRRRTQTDTPTRRAEPRGLCAACLLCLGD